MDKYQNKITCDYKILIIKPSITFDKILKLLDWITIHQVHHISKNCIVMQCLRFDIMELHFSYPRVNLT